MDGGLKSIESIAQDKRARRLARARLSFPEKIRILVRLQERRAPIMRWRGKTQRIWEIGPPVGEIHYG